jgi:hypothetical protein
MSSNILTAAQLRRVCHPQKFQFNTTADLDAAETIIGQPRGVRAIQFGLGIQSPGYNIYVLGDAGTGRTATLERFLLAHAAHQPVPPDWIYVHNFAIPHQPRALSLPAGLGRQLKGDMESLVESLKKDLPEAFDTDAYREASENIRAHYKEERNTLLEDLRQRAVKDEMTVVDTPAGWVVVPMLDGKAMSPEVYQQLPIEEHQTLERKRQSWGEELDEMLRKMRELDEEVRKQTNTMDKDVAASSIKHYFDQLHEKYAAQEAILPYMDGVYKDVLDNLDDFFPPEGDENEADLRRYEVNLLVDNSRQDNQHPGAPVVVELNPVIPICSAVSNTRCNSEPVPPTSPTSRRAVCTMPMGGISFSMCAICWPSGTHGRRSSGPFGHGKLKFSRPIERMATKCWPNRWILSRFRCR